jgi:hypothetical protein
MDTSQTPRLRACLFQHGFADNPALESGLKKARQSDSAVHQAQRHREAALAAVAIHRRISVLV